MINSTSNKGCTMRVNKQLNIQNMKQMKFESEEEFQRYKKSVELSNEDERFETQKNITICIATSFISFPFLLVLSGILNYTEIAQLLVDIAPSFFIGACGIIGVFIGGEAYKSVSKSNNY